MQEVRRDERNDVVWCYEWKAIELIKCLFDGPEIYTKDRSPNRLKNNAFFTKEALIVERALRMGLIDQVMAAKTEPALAIYMPGRGIDLLLAGLAFAWETLVIVEPRAHFRAHIARYFRTYPLLFVDNVPESMLMLSGEMPLTLSSHVISRVEPFFP
jgi:hypothetical protein